MVGPLLCFFFFFLVFGFWFLVFGGSLVGQPWGDDYSCGFPKDGIIIGKDVRPAGFVRHLKTVYLDHLHAGLLGTHYSIFFIFF